MPLLECYATTTPGLEALLASELSALGVMLGEQEPGGVAFSASVDQLSDALLWLRTAHRVLVRVEQFTARSFAELERHSKRIEWTTWLSDGDAVHFRVTSKKSRLYHEDGIAERLMRAVADSVKSAQQILLPSDAEALEDDVTVVPAVQRFVVRVMRDKFTISADASGALLHRRGYRLAVARAPLRETLAASLLLAVRWNGEAPLLDPMCGSGTIPIEAALIAANMAPGRHRRFAAERWPSCAAAVEAARDRVVSRERAVAVVIEGSDRDEGAVAAANANAERAGVSELISFRRASISHMPPDESAGWVITNPPYGARIGESDDLRALYATLARVMRERRPAWHLAMLSADRRLEGQMGIKFSELLRTTNGGIPVRVVAG